jgi:hypothetical protein
MARGPTGKKRSSPLERATGSISSKEPDLEISNPKHQIPDKHQCSTFKICKGKDFEFGYWDLEIISDLRFGYWDL